MDDYVKSKKSFLANDEDSDTEIKAEQNIDLNWELYGILNDGTFGTNSAYSHSRKFTAEELNGATVTTGVNLGVFLYRKSDDKFTKRIPDILVGTTVLSDGYLNDSLVARLSVSTAKKNTVIIKPKISDDSNMYIGSSTVSSIYIGRDKVAAIYIGTNRIL